MRNDHASLPGALIREAIRLTMRTKPMREGGLFTMGTKHAQAASRWKAPKGYMLEKLNEGGLPMEWLQYAAGGQSDCAVLQLHGGAYLMGIMDLYRKLALRYCRLTFGMPVLSIDYRIAPEHRHPAALEDTLKAWDWLTQRGISEDRIVVAGDSAGGNLALALTQTLRSQGRKLPGALVLMSPLTDMATARESREFNQERDPMFGRHSGPKAVPENAYAENRDPRDPLLSPVFADFKDFPPMLIQVGAWEILLSDARQVAERARAAGVSVTLTEYPGMFHVFQGFRDLLPESRRAWEEVGAFIQKIFK